MPDWISTTTQVLFPDLAADNSLKLSDLSPKYNCIAFAAGDTQRWWEPPVDDVLDPGQYWPADAPKNIHINSCIRAYELHGFERYSEGVIGQAFETIALYAYDDNQTAHAARLNKDGSWTSKLGDREDIRHDYLCSLEGENVYGSARLLMGRLNP